MTDDGALEVSELRFLTVAALIASELKAAHIEADRLWPVWGSDDPAPWEEGSHDRNDALVRASSYAAASFAADGFDAVLDFVLSPWHLGDTLEVCAEFSVACHYAILRAGRQTIFRRANRRRKLSNAERGAYEMMIEEFSDVGEYEGNVFDAQSGSAAQISRRVLTMLGEDRLRVSE